VATRQAEPIAVIEPLETRSRARLEELRANREKFLQEAQKNLAALDAAIGELSALLDPPSPNGRESADNADAT
jgi:Skp family chaperone for outer membrane proteins